MGGRQLQKVQERARKAECERAEGPEANAEQDRQETAGIVFPTMTGQLVVHVGTEVRLGIHVEINIRAQVRIGIGVGPRHDELQRLDAKPKHQRGEVDDPRDGHLRRVALVASWGEGIVGSPSAKEWGYASVMGFVGWEQALRNAIEVERAAARFYEQLRDQTAAPQAHAFLSRMIEVELAHAARIEHLASTAAAELPAFADPFAARVETAPGWEWVKDMDLGEALNAALESETSAALYYEALADTLTGSAQQVFTELAAEEIQHAELIRQQIKRLESEDGAR